MPTAEAQQSTYTTKPLLQLPLPVVLHKLTVQCSDAAVVLQLQCGM
jgi:hypothetical protein